LKLFLCGDVMTGRGIDQILPAPCDPALEEPWVKSALDYVALAERAPKGINYRMSPANAACLGAARIDCCVLANNHVLDWGRAGLLETLDTLRALGLRTAGAGRNAGEARAPARIGDDLLVFAFGMESAGVPPEWSAGSAQPGVSFLPDLSSQTTDALADFILASKQPGDRVAVSMHWGGNWGYEVARQKRSFARRLIDAGAADLVHGHSSHHPRPLEIYRDRLILYGCGDFLNDYEGIAGYEQYRGDLALMYFPTLDPASGRLLGLELTPLRLRRFRLETPPAADVRWLQATLDRECRVLGTAVEPAGRGRLALRW
jgi:poly-gamma-glutamate synthesis protein (capsule biosynthesis protein)